MLRHSRAGVRTAAVGDLVRKIAEGGASSGRVPITPGAGGPLPSAVTRGRGAFMGHGPVSSRRSATAAWAGYQAVGGGSMRRSRIASAGVRHPRHLRGVALRRSRIAPRAWSDSDGTSVSLGIWRRRRPLVFSTVGFRQGAWGSSEPRLGSEPGVELAPGDELQAPVEGEAAPGVRGQGRERVDEPAHDGLRAAVVVAEEHRVARRPRHGRGDVGGPVLLAEDHEIALPVAELGAAPDGLGAVPDRHVVREHGASGLPGEPRPAAPAPLRQVPRQLLALAFAGVDEPVDRLVAQPVRRRGLGPEPAGDLLGRPARTKPIDHRVPQPWVALELRACIAAPRGEALRRQRPVALGLRHLGVAPPVAPELAVDRRAVTAEPSRRVSV